MRLGILDWGIGGCGLHQLIKHKHPNATILYLSDAGYTPYGKVDKETLKERVNQCISILRDKGATHIAIACNAAGSVVDEQETITSIVHHAKRHLLSSNAIKIGVIGGQRIIESKLYEIDNRVHSAVAQPLSALIESGVTSGTELESEIERILSNLPKDIDELLLACTHYPAVIHVIASRLNETCTIIDPAQRMYDWIEANWKNFDYFQSADEWFTTGNPENSTISAMNAFDVSNAIFKKVRI